LPGDYEFVDDMATRSVENHNKFPERIFSYVDHLLGYKPNISTLALESQITFSLNKTDEWLKGKNEKEVNEMVMECRKEVRKERQRFEEREVTIRKKRLENQQLQFEKKREQEQLRIKKLATDTLETQFYGLWQKAEQVELELNQIETEKEKEEALKAQLRFRKNIFQQKSDYNAVYNFSKVVNGQRVNLTVEEMKSNVLKLVQGACEIHTRGRNVIPSI
jgi:hypothetical protein